SSNLSDVDRYTLLNDQIVAARGAVEARLAVHPANEAALGLYKSLGFVAEGDVRRDYYGPGEDRLLLRLDLAGPGSGRAPGSTDTRAAGTLSRSEGRRP
ncbi:hypothetical protein ABZ322_19380, partial [Streptomyces sp. NPDC006129]